MSNLLQYLGKLHQISTHPIYKMSKLKPSKSKQIFMKTSWHIQFKQNIFALFDSNQTQKNHVVFQHIHLIWHFLIIYSFLAILSPLTYLKPQKPQV